MPKGLDIFEKVIMNRLKLRGHITLNRERISTWQGLMNGIFTFIKEGTDGVEISGGNLTVEEEVNAQYYNQTTPTWDDLNFDPAASGGPTATLPDYITINDVIHREFTSSNNQYCGDGEELPHPYKLGTVLKPHLHCFLKSGESEGTTGVTFTLNWELRQSTGTTSGSVALTATSAELAANGHKININGTGFDGAAEIGAQLRVKLARTGGDAGDIIVTTYGVHYEIDYPGGSRQEYIK